MNFMNFMNFLQGDTPEKSKKHSKTPCGGQIKFMKFISSKLSAFCVSALLISHYIPTNTNNFTLFS
jgi:hypothetical protein